ncbi:hypothetical protein [Ferrimicrobium sp.]|uniref:hypothetical protein n=1 Tax=Ferrimicrobium sp. TaxID=2926050 RepID=UPI00262444E3|nr:hypothetical protein [Ferrimicrobium sp.]
MKREHQLDYVAIGEQADPGSSMTFVCRCGARYEDADLLESHCTQSLGQDIQRDFLAMSRTQLGAGWRQLADIAHIPDGEILSELEAWTQLENQLRAIEESDRSSDL